MKDLVDLIAEDDRLDNPAIRWDFAHDAYDEAFADLRRAYDRPWAREQALELNSPR